MNTETRNDAALIQSYAQDLERRGASAETTGQFLEALERLYPTRPTSLPARGLLSDDPGAKRADSILNAVIVGAVALLAMFQMA